MRKFLIALLATLPLSTAAISCDFETDDVTVWAYGNKGDLIGNMLVLCEAEVEGDEVEVNCWD